MLRCCCKFLCYMEICHKNIITRYKIIPHLMLKNPFEYRSIRTSCRSLFGTHMCACVKKTREKRGRKRRGCGHVPPVARDQPNGFRLTPHTPSSETSPPLLSSPLPSRRAMSVQNTPDETLLFYWPWYLSPYGALPFDTLLSSSTLMSR